MLKENEDLIIRGNPDWPCQSLAKTAKARKDVIMQNDNIPTYEGMIDSIRFEIEQALRVRNGGLSDYSYDYWTGHVQGLRVAVELLEHCI